LTEVWIIICTAESPAAREPAKEILSMAYGDTSREQGRRAEGTRRRWHGCYKPVHEGWTASTCSSCCLQSWCAFTFFLLCDSFTVMSLV